MGPWRLIIHSEIAHHSVCVGRLYFSSSKCCLQIDEELMSRNSAWESDHLRGINTERSIKTSKEEDTVIFRG